MIALADKIVDRFVCRREGHVPTVEIRQTGGCKILSWITTCRRCGKVYEIKV